MKKNPTTIGIVMDPISKINAEYDSSLGLLLAAQARGCTPYYMELKDLYLNFGQAWARMRPLVVKDRPKDWYALGSAIKQPLDTLDCILMRKDPPVDQRYMYATHVLESAEREGVLVMNRPSALRGQNEKLFATHFPQCMAPTVVSMSLARIREFIQQYEAVVVKPLDSMAGRGIFKTHATDPNLTSILDTVSQGGKMYVMVQEFLPALYETGDKRIILIDGEPIPYALARRPAEHDFRANMAAGGRGEGTVLTEHDRWICDQIGGKLRENGIFLAGIDVIGEHLTEINITSPTGIRVLERLFNADISGQIINHLLEQVGH